MISSARMDRIRGSTKFYTLEADAPWSQARMPQERVRLCGAASIGSRQIVLRARLRVDTDNMSKWITVRALADTGATHNCIAKRITDKFKLLVNSEHATKGEDFQGNEATFYGSFEAAGLALTAPDSDNGLLELDKHSRRFLVAELNDEYDIILGLPWWEQYRATPVYTSYARGRDLMVGVKCHAPSAVGIDSPRTEFTFMSTEPPLLYEEVDFNWAEETQRYIDKARMCEHRAFKEPRFSKELRAKAHAYRAAAANLEWRDRCKTVACEHNTPLAHACPECGREAFEMSPTISAAHDASSKESATALERFKSWFPEVFAEPSNEVPRRINLRFHEHAIELEDGMTPDKRPYIRLPPDKQRELRRQIEEMIRNGWVQYSNSPYSAPTFLVPKADGGWRMVVDYRALNNCTKKDAYPLPHAGDLFESLRGSTVFSKLDLKSGFYQIPLRKGDEKLTAFATVDGLFEYKVVPMGLCNAPATFMRFMNEAFADMRDDFVVIFMDDIVIHSRNKEEHELHLKRVFERLKQLKLHIKESKCKLFGSEIGFLGHHISARGMSMAPPTQSKIRDWPVPKSKRMVRSFIALAQFYAKFMKDFSTIAAPLTNLSRKDVKFVWEESHQKAFEAIKDRLGDESVVLLRYNHKLPIVIATDASIAGAGAVLQQDPDGKGLRPVEFYSYKFTEAESHWATYDQEAMAVVLALSHWRHLIEGNEHPVQIQCDHRPLAFFINSHKGKHRIARWTRWKEELAQFRLKWDYVKGETNGPADYLSRLHEEDTPEHEPTDSSNVIELDDSNTMDYDLMDDEKFTDMATQFEDMQHRTRQANEEAQHECVGDRFRVSVSAAHAMRRMSDATRAALRAARKLRRVEATRPDQPRNPIARYGALCHWQREKAYGVEVKDVPGAGKGLFATREFKRNEVIAEYMGNLPRPDKDGDLAKADSPNAHALVTDAAGVDAAYGRFINAPHGRTKEISITVNGQQVKKIVPLRANSRFTSAPDSTVVKVRASRKISPGEEILAGHGNAYARPDAPIVSAVKPKSSPYRGQRQRGKLSILSDQTLLTSSRQRLSSAPIISALAARRAAESVVAAHMRAGRSPNLAPLRQQAEPEIKAVLDQVEQMLGDAVVPPKDGARPATWVSEVSPQELAERFTLAVSKDKHYQERIIALSTNNSKDFEESVHGDLIVNRRGAVLVPADAELRTLLIATAHETEGHLGVDKTFRSLSKNYTWDGIKQQVEEFCKGCYRCQVNKPPQRKHQGTTSPLPAPEKPCEWWTIDIVGPLPETEDGNKFVVVMVDRFSKVKRIVPWKCMPSSEDIINIVEQWIVRFHGLPRLVTSDRGAQFTSALWRSYTSALGINLRISSAYHPQTDGQTERDNRTIQQLMRIYCDGDTKSWDKHIHLIELALNTMTQSSTGFSAFEILYGQPGLKLLDITLEEIKRIAKLGTRDEIPLREDGQPHTEPTSMAERGGPAADQLRLLRDGLVAAKEAIEESRKEARHANHVDNDEASEAHRLHESFLKNRAEDLAATRQRVINNINETAARMQRQAPRHPHNINPGDLVLLSKEHMRSSNDPKATRKGESQKLKSLHFEQPYEVRNTTLNTVELKLHAGDRFHPVVNVDRVKKLHGHTERNSSKTQVIPESQDPVEDDVFDVEAIKGFRWNKNAKRMEWEVKWEGYDEPTWEPRKNLSHNVVFKDYIIKFPIKESTELAKQKAASEQALAPSPVRAKAKRKRRVS
jgi:transposase InsO family protein